MKFKEFVEDIIVKVECLLDGKATATVHEVLKNNGVKLTGLSIGSNESNLSPIVYLESYWKKLGDARVLTRITDHMLQEIAEEIVTLAQRYRNKLTTSFNNWFEDWNQVKNRLAVRLINRASNDELIRNVPNRLVLGDLALVVYLVLQKENDIQDGAIGYILITNNHLHLWRKTTEEIIDVALRNSTIILPEVLCNMNDLIAEMLGEEKKEYKGIEEVLVARKDIFLVLSNSQKMYGATAILYPNVLKRIAKIINADIYILPSSVHEGATRFAA